MDSVKIVNLLNYAISHLGLDELDLIYVRNRLLEAVMENDFYDVKGNVDVSSMSCPDEVINPILDELIETNKIDISERELYLCKLLDIVSLRPSEIERNFKEIYKESKPKAFAYLYDYGNKNGYIKYSNIRNNICWETNNTRRNIDITINLSKPEKTLSEVKQAFSAKKIYPKCIICQDNMGYAGNGTAKQNLRGINLNINGDPWFFQFSPYGYFDEHGILINAKHTKMIVESDNVARLLAFLDIMPEYFIGFNAALPIVGGSILAHDHYQAGRYTLPLMKRKALVNLKLEGNTSKISILDWYNSTLQVRNKNKEELLKVTSLIINSWMKYSDEDANIICFSNDEQHNSLSAISYIENGEYVVNLILRNNITSDLYPQGVYHAHPEYHNIKQEAIGLIEAAGMFILPARLKRQLDIIASRLSKNDYVWSDDMNVHNNLYNELYNQFGYVDSKEKAIQIVKEKVNTICESILENTAVFKEDEQGKTFFNKYLSSIGLKQ